MILRRCSSSDYEYQQIRNRHYVPNNGAVGRQLHYLIYEKDGFMEDHAIGIISAGSSVWACKDRDIFFGINQDNRALLIQKIIDNTVFRLEKNEKNLASKILSLWRKQSVKDWIKIYGEEPIGFETFVYNHSGNIYKADNWKYAGISGDKEQVCLSRESGGERYGKRIRNKCGISKLIFCRFIEVNGNVIQNNLP